jgi:hypothetical protein
MRTLFTAEHLAAPKWLRSYTAFLLRRTNNLALLLHDYVEHDYCLVQNPMAVLGRKRM